MKAFMNGYMSALYQKLGQDLKLVYSQAKVTVTYINLIRLQHLPYRRNADKDTTFSKMTTTVTADTNKIVYTAKVPKDATSAR